MPLVKSPRMTPRKLAATRANGRQSAGPRTCAGKDKSMLNALKHGQYSQAFRSNLLKAGEDVALYDWIYARVCESFQPVGKEQWRECERLAGAEDLVPVAERPAQEPRGKAAAGPLRGIFDGLDPLAAGRVRNKSPICHKIRA